MTTTTTAIAPLVQGSQEPRLSSYPPVTSSAGDDAIQLAEKAKLYLDDWQKLVLRRSLGERADGKWVTPDVAVVCSRQNGKNAVLEARLLAGLFLFEEQLIIHTAHEMKAAAVTFRRIVSLVRGTPSLMKRVANIAYSKGDEGLELHNGNRLRFMARTGGSGRSFSADVLILDEAYNLPDHVMNALTPTLSARPNPQVWYTSSAVNQLEHPHGLTLARVRRRALAGGDPQLAYSEWSGDEVAYAAAEKESPAAARAYASDPAVWAVGNPALEVPRRHGGVGMQTEFLQTQLRRLGPKGFATEHLSIGDWPDEPSSEKAHVVDPRLWDELVDRTSAPDDPVAFAVHAEVGQTAAAVCVAGKRPDGRVHVEVLAHQRGITWVVEYMVARVERNQPCAVVIDPAGPAGSLIVPLQAAGIEVTTVTAREYAQACGAFYVAATERVDDQAAGGLVHQDDIRLNNALEGAETRPLSGAWVWTFETGAPLVAVTLAMHGLAVHGDDNDGTVNLW